MSAQMAFVLGEQEKWKEWLWQDERSVLDTPRQALAKLSRRGGIRNVPFRRDMIGQPV